jgi:hypothetical protein
MSATAPIHGNLEAYLNAGHLDIDGHDLGPAIVPVKCFKRMPEDEVVSLVKADRPVTVYGN